MRPVSLWWRPGPCTSVAVSASRHINGEYPLYRTRHFLELQRYSNAGMSENDVVFEACPNECAGLGAFMSAVIGKLIVPVITFNIALVIFVPKNSAVLKTKCSQMLSRTLSMSYSGGRGHHTSSSRPKSGLRGRVSHYVLV